jgi:ABC-2 type transport system ATP-binding protein
VTTPREPSPGPAIEAHAVGRSFRNVTALHEVDLTCDVGEVHALLGPNGAGKTTLVRLMAGLLAPTSGSVSVLGLDSSANPLELRRRVGLVPSGERSFYLRISGLENLVFFARLHGFGRSAALVRARSLARDVGIDNVLDRPASTYSSGMLRRLAVARALIADPPVLLLDEPTQGLDPDGVDRTRALARSLAGRGAAVIWTTQRLDEIRGFADAVTVLDRGEVRFAGTVTGLLALARPRSFVLQLQNGRSPREALDARVNQVLAGVGSVRVAEDGTDQYLLELEDGATLGEAIGPLLATDIRVLACAEARSALEEAFLRLTREQA